MSGVKRLTLQKPAGGGGAKQSSQLDFFVTLQAQLAQSASCPPPRSPPPSLLALALSGRNIPEGGESGHVSQVPRVAKDKLETGGMEFRKLHEPTRGTVGGVEFPQRKSMSPQDKLPKSVRPQSQVGQLDGQKQSC